MPVPSLPQLINRTLGDLTESVHWFQDDEKHKASITAVFKALEHLRSEIEEQCEHKITYEMAGTPFTKCQNCLRLF